MQKAFWRLAVVMILRYYTIVLKSGKESMKGRKSNR